MSVKRRLALFALPLLLNGCNSLEEFGDGALSSVGLEDDAPKSYTSSVVSKAQHTGIAVADEPLAAQAGAAVLTAHGDAADAVATMFFTLTATYPAAAGLGGGGICLVRDVSGRVVEFDFLTKAPKAGGAFALPGAVAGFYSIQRQYGAMPWQRVVAPGEAYAATGFPVSQALASRVAAAQDRVRQDAVLAAELLDKSGQPLVVGSETHNTALGQTLTQIRLNGADGFNTGLIASGLVAYSSGAAGGLTLDEMAAARPLQGAARSRGLGNLTVWLPGPATGAGAFTGTLMNNLARQRDLVAATSAALASFGVNRLPGDLGSTGFAAVDADGQAAACAVTLNGPFGSGRTATGTGVVLAATPSDAAGLASAFLTPVIAANGGSVALSGAGAGGPNGTAAALYAVSEVAGGRALGKRGDLRGTGAAPFDTVNMISCSTDSCVALTDPGAHGAAAAAQTASN